MKAAIIDRYGPPEQLHIEQVAKPTINDSQLLVQVVATAVTAADVRIRAAKFPKGFGAIARLAFGIRGPRAKILGSTYSGVVVAAGKRVPEFSVGDEVCGMTGVKMGTYAEFVTVNNVKSIAKKPANVSHTHAAGMLFGGTAALYFLRDKLNIKQGETILINGASGAVGTNAVQLAKLFGATITGVTTQGNAALVKELGATEIIDYTKQDIAAIGKKFDVLLDTVGNISPEAAKPLLTRNGRAGLMVASLGEMIRMRGPVKSGTATEKREDIEYLLSLMKDGKLKAVIDSEYTIDHIVEAHRHVDSGRKVGSCIVTLR